MPRVSAQFERLKVLIRGAGELASATAHHLHGAGIRSILMLELKHPKAVRRNVCFSEAVYEGVKEIDGVRACLAETWEDVWRVLGDGHIAVATFPLEEALRQFSPDVYVEAAMLRSNWGLTKTLAPIVIALGPGYVAGRDCHAVVDTFRGPKVGNVIEEEGERIEEEGPATILGYSHERLLKAPGDGIFLAHKKIGDRVTAGDRIGQVLSAWSVEDLRKGVPPDASYQVKARVSGVVRGLLRSGTPVKKGDKLGDIDPRGWTPDIEHISDKAKRVAEGVHEALVDLMPLLARRKCG